MNDLVGRLKAIQEAHKWTDQQMAGRMGISRPMWSAVRNGESRLGASSLGPIARNFPELKEEIFAYIQGGEPEAVAA